MQHTRLVDRFLLQMEHTTQRYLPGWITRTHVCLQWAEPSALPSTDLVCRATSPHIWTWPPSTPQYEHSAEAHVPLNATRGFRRQHSLSGSMIAAKMSFSLKQHELAHYNLRIRPSSVCWSPVLLRCVCHQAFWTELLWESRWRKMCLPTLMHTWHARPHDGWLTQMQGGINVRDQLRGLNLALSGCGLTPHAVCVTVSHGKNCSAAELWARGGCCCWSRVCFQWWGWATHVDTLREILSTLCPRHVVGVRSIESQWPHTPRIHAVNRKLPFFSV